MRTMHWLTRGSVPSQKRYAASMLFRSGQPTRPNSGVIAAALVAILVAVQLLFVGCAQRANRTSGPGFMRVFYTAGSPSSIVKVNDGLWFAYGMNLNGRTGAGHVHDGRLESIETSSLGLADVSDVISDHSGHIFFFAAGEESMGILGEITPNTLRVLWRDRGMTTITYDQVSRRILFLRSDANRYGWYNPGGKTVACSLSGGPYYESRDIGAALAASSRGGTWIYIDASSSLVRLKGGCSRSAPVRVPSMKGEPLVSALVVDDAGSAWLLDKSDEALLSVNSDGHLRISEVPRAADLTALGIVNGRVCIAAHDPNYIACIRGKTWKTVPLPVAGAVTALTGDTRTTWLAYGGFDDAEHWNVGGIVTVPTAQLIGN